MQKFLCAVGDRLRDHRESKGYTQREVAKLCCMNDWTISMLEAGKTWPGYPVFDLVCRSMGTSPHAILSPFRWVYRDLEGRISL